MFSDFFSHEQETRLAEILDRAFNSLDPEERRIRQRRIARGEAPMGVQLRGHMDPETGLPVIDTDPEMGALCFDWGGSLLVVIAPEILERGSQSPASSN